MAITIITTPQIDVNKLKEMSVDLLDALVHGDASPFKDMKEVLDDYLDSAPDLDATQKAGIFADTLKGMYKDINSQVLNTAVQVLKSNGDFELDKYKVQAGYNTSLAGLPKIEEDVKLTAATVLKVQKETEILSEDQDIKAAQLLEHRAKLIKQYGMQETATGSGILVNTTAPGAIDKQIRGYDVVNLKDALKTADERAALMQNAKVPETTGEKLLRKELMEAITGATITVDASGNITSVTDIVV